MVMNESFADMNVGGTNYADNIIPYYLSLENTIRGNLYVDVRGGGTCNSEYESLTGNTTASLRVVYIHSTCICTETYLL